MNDLFQRRHYVYLATVLPFVLYLNEAEVERMAVSLDKHNTNFNMDRFMEAWRNMSEKYNEE